MGVMEIRRAMVAAQDQFVPPGYQVYDYIQTSGHNARFDTGVSGNDESLVFDFTYMRMSNVSYRTVFGNYTDESTRCWRLLQATTSYPRIYLCTMMNRRAGSSTSIGGVSTETGTTVGHKTHFNMSYGKCTVLGDDGFSYTHNQTADSTTAVSERNIAIGAPNIFTTGGSDAQRIYGHFKIWSQNKLVRNYVPVVRKSDSKAGFYDTVNHTFNPSIGSVDFVAGNDT